MSTAAEETTSRRTQPGGRAGLQSPHRQLQFARFKGLGEMDPHELRETCMDPASRHLVQLDLDEGTGADDHTLSILMGDDVEARRNWIQHNAKDVRFLDV